MAKFDAILSFSLTPAQKTAALGATTSSAEIIVGTNVLFAINATKDITIKMGVSGMAAAAATDFRLPANIIAVIDSGRTTDRLRVFNLDAAVAADIYIQQMSVG